MNHHHFTRYFIPGWGFKSSIIQASPLNHFNCKPLDYHTINGASLTEIAECLGQALKKNSFLLGWSLGGLIAIQIANLFPDKVQHIALLACQARFLEDQQWPGVSQCDADELLSLVKNDLPAAMNTFLKWVNYPNCNNTIKQQLQQHTLPLDSTKHFELLTMLFKSDLREEYQSLHCPRICINGSRDAIVAQHSNATVVKTAGHAGFLTHGAQYIKILEEFLNHDGSD